MADSPGKVLSSFASSNEQKGSSSKLGGCAGVFFQLLDRFNGKKLFPQKLLPSERLKHNTISHTEEKLPMAKLLLIADENRIGSLRRDGESISDGVLQRNENHEERQGKKPVSVVARLMGLETMPSPEPFIRERKLVDALRDNREAQCTKKLLQSKQMLIEKAQKSTRAMDTRIQTLKRRTKAIHPGQICRFEAKVTGFNSVPGALKQSSTKRRLKSHIKARSCETTEVKERKVEDIESLFFSQLPSMPPIQVDSPLRTILSPSRTSSKLLSPIKSPLSSKSTVRLFGVAARVLEPSLRPVRHLGLHSHNAKPVLQRGVSEDTNEQKVNMLGASIVPLLAPLGAQSRGPVLNDDSNVALSSSPIVSMECKGLATNSCSNSTHEGKAQFSLNDVNAEEPFISKPEEAKTLLQAKKSNKNQASKRKLVTPALYRQEASSPTSGGAFATSKSSKAPPKSPQLNSKQVNVLLPVLVKEENSNQDEALRRSKKPINSRSGGCSSLGPRTIKGSSISTLSNPSRTARSLQGHRNSSQALPETMSREGSRNSAKTGSPKAGKAASLSKTNSVDARSKSGNAAQMKGGSSCSKPSSKRKASTLSPKPAVPVAVLTAEEGKFRHYDAEDEGMMQRFGAISSDACDEESNYYQSDSGTSVMCLDDINAASSGEAEPLHMRVRARWDIADERRINITKTCISFCGADRASGSSSTRGGTSKASGTAAGILEELFLSLKASTSQPSSLNLDATDDDDGFLFCKDGSEALHDHSLRCGSDLTGVSTDFSTVSSNFFGGDEQRPSSYEGFSPREDTSIRDSESVADSLCTEECGQPSPISILESPFLDSASSSSDNFEAPQGSKQWEANANEPFDCMSTMGKQMEDVESYDTQTMADGQNFMDLMCRLHCMDPAVLDVDADNNTVIECTDSYVKKILGAVMSPELEEPTWRAEMPPDFCIEKDYGGRACKCVSFTSRGKEASVPKRKLVFDCIEEALRLSLEVARQSYGISVSYMQLPAAHFIKAVCKQIDYWKELAVSMNLDDMMKLEINEGMGSWFNFGNEAEKLAENVETTILKGLMDELMKDILIKVPALCVCG
eukprot:c22650_g1_i2 orf=1221-4472(+)